MITNQPENFIGTNDCYYFTGKDAQGRKTTAMNGNSIVLEHYEGIIDSEIWLNACRSKQIHPPQKVRNIWLAGMVKCARCGYALVDKKYKCKEVRCLLCSRRMNAKTCEGTGSLHTDEIADNLRSDAAEAG